MDLEEALRNYEIELCSEERCLVYRDCEWKVFDADSRVYLFMTSDLDEAIDVLLESKEEI